MRYVKFMVLAVMVLALAACGGGEAAEGGNGGGGDDAVTLGQTLTGTDMLGGEVTINYPDGWAVQNELESSGSAIFASSQDLLEMEGSASVPAGQAGAVVSILPEDALAPMMGDQEFSLEALATLFSEMMAGEGLELGEYEEITVNGQTIGRVAGSAEESGAVMLMRELENGGVIMLNGLTAGDEVANFEPTFRAIMGSVSYTAAE